MAAVTICSDFGVLWQLVISKDDDHNISNFTYSSYNSTHLIVGGCVWVVYVPPLESECTCDRSEWQSMVKILPCDSQWSISILVWFVVQWQSQEPWDNSVLSLYPVCVMAWSSPVLFGSPDKPSSVTSVGSPLASMPGKAVALQDSIFWKWDNAVICGLSLSFQHPGGFMFQE